MTTPACKVARRLTVGLTTTAIATMFLFTSPSHAQSQINTQRAAQQPRATTTIVSSPTNINETFVINVLIRIGGNGRTSLTSFTNSGARLNTTNLASIVQSLNSGQLARNVQSRSSGQLAPNAQSHGSRQLARNAR